MNVFRVAVLKNAVKVLLVHNHPSGELKPSDDDIKITILKIRKKEIEIGISAPVDVVISREEVYNKKKAKGNI